MATHAPKLDDKGRVILPARFREELANGLVLTRGQERCIYVFTAKDFDARVERVEALREHQAWHRLAREAVANSIGLFTQRQSRGRLQLTEALLTLLFQRCFHSSSEGELRSIPPSVMNVLRRIARAQRTERETKEGKAPAKVKVACRSSFIRSIGGSEPLLEKYRYRTVFRSRF